MVVEISVRGEAEGRYAAERAVVLLAAVFEGAAKDQMYDHAVALQKAIAGQLAELVDRGAVATWSSDDVAMSTHRPWLGDGRRGGLMHVARIGLSAEFVDFERLSGFLDHWSGRDGVEVAGVTWDLLEKNRRWRTAELRRAAVDDAAEKAQAYAEAVRRGRVTPIRVADPGLLSPSGGGAVPYALASRMAGGEGNDGLRLTPAPVVIRVAVEAAFAAD
ncbi:MAG: SIMPL domain-containing protein [Aeromicrobium sp.]